MQTIIEFPLKGLWAIMNPPAHPERAYDFLAVDERGRPYPGWYLLPHLFSRIPVTAIYAWAQPVFSPFDGQVVECSDGSQDRERVGLVRDLIGALVFRPKQGSPFSAFGGNYVVLRSGNLFALLAHLRKGSLMVAKGDSVRVGQQLGEVGNSGASIQPHLHFQLMIAEDPFPISQNLLPVELRSGSKRVKKRWQPFKDEEIRNGDQLEL